MSDYFPSLKQKGLEYKINSAAKEGFVVTNTFVKPLPDNYISPQQYIAFMESTF